jgi:hypothetical protein
MITSVGVVITSYLHRENRVALKDLRTSLQLDDVWMTQHLQILNLPLDPRIHIWRCDLGPVDQLEGDLVASYAMRRD